MSEVEHGGEGIEVETPDAFDVPAQVLEQVARQLELRDIEEQQKQLLVQQALRKFNFFLHLTAYISGCAFLLILGILISSIMPYVFIPIGLWTIGLAYHFTWAFYPQRVERIAAGLRWIRSRIRDRNDGT